MRSGTGLQLYHVECLGGIRLVTGLAPGELSGRTYPPTCRRPSHSRPAVEEIVSPAETGARRWRRASSRRTRRRAGCSRIPPGSSPVYFRNSPAWAEGPAAADPGAAPWLEVRGAGLTRGASGVVHCGAPLSFLPSRSSEEPRPSARFPVISRRVSLPRQLVAQRKSEGVHPLMTI